MKLPDKTTLLGWGKLDLPIVLAGIVVGFLWSADFLHWMIRPFRVGTNQDVSLISIKLLGVLLVKIKIAIFVGALLVLPLLIAQLYMSIMRDNGYRAYTSVIPAFLGYAFNVLLYLPWKISYIYSIVTNGQAVDGFGLMPDIEAYLNYLMWTTLMQGLVFQSVWLVGYSIYSKYKRQNEKIL